MLRRFEMGDHPITPQLHRAGATVIHQSPFAALEVPVSQSPLSEELRTDWVLPLYMKWHDDPAATAAYLRPRFAQVTPDLVVALLAQFDWRPRSTAALLAALRPLPELTTHIGRLLLRSDVCCAGSAYCLALVRFNSPEARDFLCEYLGHYLRRVDLWFDQGCVLAALHHLDAVHGRTDAEAFLPLWRSFVANKPNWSLKGSIAHFESRLACLVEISAQIQPSPR